MLVLPVDNGRGFVSGNKSMPPRDTLNPVSFPSKVQPYHNISILTPKDLTGGAPKHLKMAISRPTRSPQVYSRTGQRFSKREVNFGSNPQSQPEISLRGDTESGSETGNVSDSSVSSHRSKPTLDTDVAALVQNFASHVIIRDLAVKDARNIELPRDFALDSEITPEKFFATRKEIQAHRKRKRQDEVIPKSLDLREQGGYRPHEVIGFGAVAFDGCTPSSLDNEIHPLLARSRFDETPDALYDTLIPALRLASMFLSKPACMQFWVTLALGERTHDPGMSAKYGRHCTRIAHHVPLTKQNTAQLIRHLRKLGESDLIHFKFKHKLLEDIGPGAWGTSSPVCDYMGVSRRSHSSLTRSVIRLHADMYIAAKKLCQLKYHETSQQLRFCFFFATLLIHELAHSIEGAYIQLRPEQWARFQDDKSYMEPFMLHYPRSELGKCWEDSIFGGEIQPINSRVDGLHGIGVTDWPPHGTDKDPDKVVWWTVSMEHISHLFKKETWGKLTGLDSPCLKIPRTGAMSFYINYFTTMRRAEEQRIAREDTAEEVLRNQREQPAPKVRVKADGKKEEQRPLEAQVVETALKAGKEVAREEQKTKNETQKEEASQQQKRALTAVFEKAAKIRGTKKLAEIMSALPTSREDGEEDKVVLTCQQLFDLASTGHLQHTARPEENSETDNHMPKASPANETAATEAVKDIRINPKEEEPEKTSEDALLRD